MRAIHEKCDSLYRGCTTCKTTLQPYNTLVDDDKHIKYNTNVQKIFKNNDPAVSIEETDLSE